MKGDKWLRMVNSEKKFSPDSMPEDIRWIMTRFLESGFEVWLVGGALRDFLHGWNPKDWDLATNASPQQVIDLFPRVIPLGLRHGTVKIQTGKETIEVTTFPADSEGILADLQRRDFTVNALALSYPDGQLIDPFGGQEDILSLTLRSVGNASCRFSEDPLRTLRAGRFISVYGFKVEPRTLAAIQKAASGLQRVSRERIREEFFRMLLGKYFSRAFNVMRRSGVIHEFLPELTAWHNPFLGVTANTGSPKGGPKAPKEEAQPDFETALEENSSKLIEHCVKAAHFSPLRLRVRLGALFHHLGDLTLRQFDKDSLQPQQIFREGARAAASIMQRLRASRRLEQEVTFLMENQVPENLDNWTQAQVRFFLASLAEGFLEDVMELAIADGKAREGPHRRLRILKNLRVRISRELKYRVPLRIEDLAINGRDVMKILNLEPGPAVGDVIRRLQREVLECPALNEPKILMDFLNKEYHIEPGREDSDTTKGDKDAGQELDE